MLASSAFVSFSKPETEAVAMQRLPSRPPCRGNAMVILAFLVDKNLRRRSNYFFLNLAISDFFVGAISIPLYIPYRMFDWNFGNKTCVFWLIIDYLLCTTSVYNIVLISYDRYQSVSNAVYYRARHTGILKMVALMLSVWALAFFVHGPAILFSQSWKIGENCEPGFFSVWYILVITSLLEFLLPIFSVAYFNMYIYWSLWKRCNLSRWQSHPDLTSPVSSRNCGLSLKCGLFSRTSLPEPKEAVVSLHSERQGRKNSLLFPLRAQMNCNVIASKVNSLFHSDSLALRQREHLELLKARKLGKSLAILLGITRTKKRTAWSLKADLWHTILQAEENVCCFELLLDIDDIQRHGPA
ncbi:Histamine H4 Receptor [Manis pentadactyla]|nr:Histamine H4 Receptor [Manis pentadactyla]